MDQIVCAGHAVIEERSCQYLAAIRVVCRAFRQRLSDPLREAAMYLRMYNHRIDHRADIVNHVIALELDHARVGVYFDLQYVAAVRIGEIGWVVECALIQAGLNPVGKT